MICYNYAMSKLATNPKAKHDYAIVKEYEAGIQLTGAEVKSVKNGRVQIKDSFVKLDKNNEAHLHNAYIAPYAQANAKDYNPYRSRKLLLHRSQLDEMKAKTQGQNLTIIPIQVYNVRRGLIKVQIALAKGKRKYEKRRTLKEAAVKKEIDRTLKNI